MQFIFQFTNMHLLISTDPQQHDTSDLQRNNLLASDWEGLITKQRTTKQITLGMALHRITSMNSFCFNLLFALLYP